MKEYSQDSKHSDLLQKSSSFLHLVNVFMMLIYIYDKNIENNLEIMSREWRQ